MRRLLLILAAVACMGLAADPAERLADPAQEARARHIFSEVRCLVCQNESIDDSEAPLAHDLRVIVRGQIVAGRTDAEIRAFLVERYGEFVLFRPPFSPGNALLWLAPVALAAFGAGLWLMLLRRREPTPDLSPEEEARLAALAEE
jgi:cytochrome c-type biogenesis protein CcmH